MQRTFKVESFQMGYYSRGLSRPQYTTIAYVTFSFYYSWGKKCEKWGWLGLGE